jgi:hypothetical protein
MAPEVGLEPTTLRLTAECSAIELLRIACKTQAIGRSHFTLYIKCVRVGQRSADLHGNLLTTTAQLLYSVGLLSPSTLQRNPKMIEVLDNSPTDHIHSTRTPTYR